MYLNFAFRMIEIMFLFGLLAAFLGSLKKIIYEWLYGELVSWRHVLNMTTAWFISVPVGCTFMPYLSENIFISMWLCSTLIMIIRSFTIQNSILVGSLNGLFWYLVSNYSSVSPCLGFQ